MRCSKGAPIRSDIGNCPLLSPSCEGPRIDVARAMGDIQILSSGTVFDVGYGLLPLKVLTTSASQDSLLSLPCLLNELSKMSRTRF